MNTPAEALRAALSASPQQAELWYRLAQVEATTGNPAGAVPILQEGLQHCPEQPDLLYLLANSLHHMGALTQAIEVYGRCITLAPHITEACIELPLALLKAGRFVEAEAAARHAVNVAPVSDEARINLGTVLCRQHRYVEAMPHFDGIAANSPMRARACNQAALAWQQLGENEKCIALLDQALTLQPSYTMASSNLALARLYAPPSVLSNNSIKSNGYIQSARAVTNATANAKPIRLGFVSSDLRQHVVGLFLLPLFAHRSRGAIEYHVYNISEHGDAYTQALKQGADAWTEARLMNDATLAQKIAADGIDILFDLNGHTVGNRLGVFAFQPAPVQMSWLGYPGYVHAPGIDYRLTDAVLDPPDADVEGMETPVRLPHAFFCYTPPPAWGGDLAVSELPALERGAMTFGAFNEMAKVTTDCLTAWAKVLNAVKGSRLLWRARCFEEAAARELGYARLHKLGLQRSQVDLLPMDSAPARHMAIYSQVDIHLDTFPYTGGTTTCDALWHGVPVVTLQGVRPSDRLGATVLHHVGRDEWIAHCSEAYVDIALRLAGDVMALQHCRATLRQQFAASPMHDAAGFARGFEHVCRNRLATHRHAVVA